MVSLKDHADGAMRGLLGHGLVELFLSLKIWRSVLPELAQGAQPRASSPQPPPRGSAVLVALEEEEGKEMGWHQRALWLCLEERGLSSSAGTFRFRVRA